MLGFLIIYYEADIAKNRVTVTLDQFLSKNIHGQFINFKFLQKFRYQAYLLKFIVDVNLEELHNKVPEAFVDLVTLSEEVGVFSHDEFINNIMSNIYELIYEDRFPRVIEDMRKALQLKKGKTTGDWFLYWNHIVIRVYGFCGLHFTLLTFLTPRIFYLEFSRQGIAVEELHFTRAHKTSNLKFPFTLGPFTFKVKYCLAILDVYMCHFY